jgi:hypothetical protein
VDPSSIAAAARQDAVTRARRLLRERTIALLVVGVVGCLGALALALAPLVGDMRLVAAWAVVWAVAAGWLVVALFPRARGRSESGFPVNVVEEPRLHEWVVELARRIGVSAPDAIRIAPATGVWIDQLETEPTLVIGAGSIGWLTRDELDRVVGIELTMLRVRDDETVRSALRLAESVRVDRLCRCAAPVVGGAVRLLGRRLAVDADDLREACVAWALEAVPPELAPTDDDLKEAELVDEAWALLDDRWLAPAARLGLALDTMMSAHRELLTACEQNGLVERSYQRDRGPTALSLLSDPEGVDVELAGWTAARLATCGDGIVGWDEFPQRVAVPTWRQTAADAVAAAGASGHPQPPTIDALVKALDSGLGVSMGTAMVEPRERAQRPHAEPAPPTGQQIDTAVADAIAHAACLAMVESGLAEPSLDVLWGVRLVDENDEQLDVDPNVRRFVAAGDIGGLRWYVQSLGFDTSEPLPLDGVSAVSPLPEGAALVGRARWHAYDLVVSSGTLLGFRHSPAVRLRSALSRLGGSCDDVRELDPTLTAALEHDDPADRPPAQLAVALDTVSRAELHRTPRGSGWRLRLHTDSGAVRLSGDGDGRLIAGLLELHLGSRLQHTGLSLRPNRLAVAIGKASWYTIWGGVLVLLAGAVGLVNVLNAPSEQTSGTQAMQVVLTFGVFGVALIAIGLLPYRFIARRAHEPGLR